MWPTGISVSCHIPLTAGGGRIRAIDICLKYTLIVVVQLDLTKLPTEMGIFARLRLSLTIKSVAFLVYVEINLLQLLN